MALKRSLVVPLAAGAALLVLGRAFAFLYTRSAWYASLDARALWLERLADTAILYATTLVAATAFALLNFSAVRHSILSLVLPRRLGNVEFAEAVSPRRLDLAAVTLAIIVALIGAFAVPPWTSLALARTATRFNEMDPYHQLDMGFYTTWLPLEMQLQSWAWVVVLTTTFMVIALYSLTPGLRWREGTVHMTGWVRRHLSTLAAVILLMLAWRARVSSYTLLFEGSGPDGGFTAVDHRWLLPANVLLTIGTIVAAAVFLWSAWSRQAAIGFAALTGALLLWLGVRQILPLVARPAVTDPAAVAADAPYAETRDAFTRRAFRTDDGVRAGERVAPGADLDRNAVVTAAISRAHVAPGAQGFLIVGGDLGSASPALSSVASRLAHAWEERDTRLLGGDFPERASILRVRDLSARLREVAPVFTQGSRPAALFRADTLYWMVDLYTASSTYPLSRRLPVGGERRGYFRHAATAYVQAMTGATHILLDSDADPIARAWQRRFPQVVRPSSAAPPWLEELSLAPAAPVPQAGEADSLFRARVRQLYIRMRAALSSSDLATFGEWFDSLGALLRRQEEGSVP